MWSRSVTYVVAGTGTVAGVVDGPAAGSRGTAAVVVGGIDVLFEDSVFLKTVFILISSFFPALFTLSSRPSAGVPPTLEAMSIDVKVRALVSQRRYVGVTEGGHVVGCGILYHVVRAQAQPQRRADADRAVLGVIYCGITGALGLATVPGAFQGSQRKMEKRNNSGRILSW